MRVTLVISSLSCGGAERVLSMMANYWATRVEKVTLITFESANTDFYALDPRIRRVGLGLRMESADPWAALGNNLRRIIRLRRAVLDSKPEIVISFIHRVNVSTLLATIHTSVPVIISERTDPTAHPLGRTWSALRGLLYPKAAAVITQSEAASQWARRFVRKDRVHRLPNPVRKPSTVKEPGASLTTGGTVLAVGRLSPVKGFDLLIRAFTQCVPEHSDWTLTILGEGPERSHLEALAEELTIRDRVSLPGQVEKPEREFASADLFVLSSRYEGFPNGLLEAMASGLAVVSFDCPSGPAEIIHDGVDGALIEREDVDALAVNMSRLMGDETERRRLGSRAAEVTERFGLEKVMGLWEDILGSLQKKETIMSTHAEEIAGGERFGFGENWSRFLEVLDEERIQEAEKSLRQMLGATDLEGKSFLDMGSGSGLFSLSARRLGARVHSFDYDPQSVACTHELQRRYFPEDETWTVEEGNALDREYVESLGEFDMVYSWGVLHHTGDMWLALENAARPVAGGGRLFIAIYNDQGGTSRRWRKVKQVYISGERGRKAISAAFIPYFVVGGLVKDVLRGRNPIARYTEYKKSRGMSRTHDWHDWLGGYPFEVAKPEEIFAFYRDRGFTMDRLTTCGGGLGNNQFVFTRRP